MRKYTYLSNDSSYSASPEDGVEIKFLDNNLSDEINDLHYADESANLLDSSTCRDGGSKSVQNFTFEAQVRCNFFLFLYMLLHTFFCCTGPLASGLPCVTFLDFAAWYSFIFLLSEA